MSIPPKEIRLKCGCMATWDNREEQYIAHHTCSAKERQVKERMEWRRMRDEERKRMEMPLYHRYFSLFK